MDFLIFIFAMSALIFGADFIIKESERIALHFNISHYVIGATLIAFGTSLPEMAASVMASSQQKSDLAVANVIGSVIFNITLVLGSVFLFSKAIQPNRNLFAQDSAWVIVPVVMFFIMIQDEIIGRFDGFLYLLLMTSYLVFLFTDSSKSIEDEIDQTLTKNFNWMSATVMLLTGFSLTIGGAHYVIESATNIANFFGVSEWIIGLFLISLGTSLPELVVSLVAIKKGNLEMSIGNIIGSNVANFSMVLGIASIVRPLTINLSATYYDILIMTAASVVLLFILANKLYNKAGGIFLLMILALFIQSSLPL